MTDVRAALAATFDWMEACDVERISVVLDGTLRPGLAGSERQRLAATLLQSWGLPFTVATVMTIVGGSRASAAVVVATLLRAAARSAGQSATNAEAASEDADPRQVAPSAERAVIDPVATTASKPAQDPLHSPDLGRVEAAVASLCKEVGGLRGDFQWLKTMIDTERQLSAALRRERAAGANADVGADAAADASADQARLIEHRRRITDFTADLATVRHTRASPLESSSEVPAAVAAAANNLEIYAQNLDGEEDRQTERGRGPLYIEAADSGRGG